MDKKNAFTEDHTHANRRLNPSSCVSEIVVIKSDTATDPLTHFVPPFGNPEIIFYVGQTHQIKNVTCANGLIKGQYNIAQKIDFIPDYHFCYCKKIVHFMYLCDLNLKELSYGTC